MERDGRLALSVGTFVLVALLALAVSILSLTTERGLFAREYRLQAPFENVLGLQVGAPVWLAGKEVGRVESIQFTTGDETTPVLATLAIDTAVQDFIRSDSVASIGTIGVLGDSYVELSVGSEGSRRLEEDDVLSTLTPVNMNQAMAKVTAAVDSIRELSENLNGAVESFVDSDGSAKVAKAVDAVTETILEVREGEGLIHQLIFADFGTEGLGSLERSFASMESVMSEIANGDGILHTLIYESPRDQDMVTQIVTAGTRLNSILGKIDQAEGTLGLLVNDPSLYDDLQTLLGGAQRSLLIRSMVRMAVDAAEDEPASSSGARGGSKEGALKKK
jgi:phospholipid/cholesterol/gamma-HCH transport system substrate-binding protein